MLKGKEKYVNDTSLENIVKSIEINPGLQNWYVAYLKLQNKDISCEGLALWFRVSTVGVKLIKIFVFRYLKSQFIIVLHVQLGKLFSTNLCIQTIVYVNTFWTNS